ncbi:MAG: MMPL family transporter [Thermoflexaceae bacterium]|nr:MMPL family transporter [Thermoflexaceae bacterium]
MQKFAEKIVKLRIPILIICILLLIPSFIGFVNTRINYDILYYLPDDIETMQGQDILMDEFGKGAYGMIVCNGMSSADIIKLTKKLENIDHVEDIICYDSITGGKIPKELLPQEVRKIFYSEDGTGTLMFIFFDTTTSADETMDAIEEIRRVMGEQCFLSSMSSIATDTKNLVENEMAAYTIIAVILCLLVLFLTTDSFLIPVLFMISIGMAIIYNLGSNFIQGEISYITMALVAILQLGVTMDYSIFLYHSYKEEQKKYPDSREAMSHAIASTIVSVTGSSLTTIAGFLAMCFMTFTLGLDMGIVMAKGVVIGVICCVTVLPSFILTFDRAVKRTSHKALELRTGGITKFVTSHYIILAILMVILWIPAVYGNNNVQVYYKLDESLPDYLSSRKANKALEEGFDMNSISMVLVNADLPAKDTKALLSDLDNVEGVSFALGLDSITGALIPEEIIPKEVKEMLSSENWKLLLVSSIYQVATDEVNTQCEELERVIKSYDPDGMLIGEAAATKDLVKITNRDFNVVSVISIGAIFVLILFVLKSVTLPVILVLVIELAINVNMSISYYMGTTLPFIASICVGTIQLGATVDYAILMTTRYKKERMDGHEKKEAVQIALSTSINSIFSSALGFFAATIGVGIYSDVDLIGAICMLLARGALLSMVIVILMLPAMFMVFDRLICKTTAGMRKISTK